MCGRQDSEGEEHECGFTVTLLIIHGGHVGEKLSGAWILPILFVQVGLQNGL